jgi:hypothetical protein
MGKLKKFWATWFLFAALCVFPIRYSLAGSVPQGETVSRGDAAALSTLSEYLVGRVDLAHMLLRKHGYQPTVNDTTWHQFPSVRKLETAYMAAETASPGHGGEKLLALLASDLAQQYEGIRAEPALTDYLRRAASITTPVRFANRPAELAMPHLSQPVEAAIDTLSQYCSRGPGGTPQSILKTHFGLSEDTAYQILRQSNSNAEAFKRAMTYVPEQERTGALKSLISHLTPKFETLPHEPSLRPFIDPPASASPSVFPPTLSGPRPLVPSRGTEIPSATERYPTFVRENYSTPASMSFSVMAEAVEGFGGIVFGNQVSAAPDLPKVVSVSFDRGPATNSGLITYHFANSSSSSFGNVLVEDAYAAYHMVFEGIGGVIPTELGKGVGLVSLNDNAPTFVCEKDTLKVTESSKFNVVLHPALANIDLGWAAVMVDALPIEPDLIRTTVRENGLSEDEELAVKNLFLSIHTPSFVHNWKVVDVPLTVGLDGNSLVVRRSGEDPSIPIALRRASFIEMRPMLEKGFDSEFARNFYQYVPILTKGSRDYRRLNDFAGVLAVFRLAKMEGAVFPSPPPSPHSTPTPDAIQISKNSITAVAPFVRGGALTAALAKANHCIAEATSTFPQLRQRLDEMKKLETEHDKAKMDAYLTDEGSAEERTANQLVRKLDTEIDQKLHSFQALPEGAYILSLYILADEIGERLELEQLAQRESQTTTRSARRRASSQP